MPETDTDAQEVERQCREASMRIRCPPTENEIELPAYADGLSIISTASKENRFIGASRRSCENTSLTPSPLDVI